MSAIKAGDLVMVVRGSHCCGATSKMNGVPFVVSETEAMRFLVCDLCGHVYDEINIAYTPGKLGVDVRRLIRIDPPALPESVETEREVAA